MPHVAVILLNWRGYDDTRACCVSLREADLRGAQVYVVDNGSADGSAGRLRAEFAEYRHLSFADNKGYAGGNNAAMEHALSDGADFVILLNNDTTVDPGFLTNLLNAASQDPQRGMVGPKMCIFAAPETIWYAGGTVSFSRWYPFGHNGEGENDSAEFNRPKETEFISGCCVLIRSETIKQIGLLDERFGLYCEDVDWCLRARAAGWKLWYEPRAVIYHKVSRSTVRARIPASYYGCRNALMIAKTHAGFFTQITLSCRALVHAFTHSMGNQASTASILRAVGAAFTGEVGLQAAAHPGRSAQWLALAMAKVRRVVAWVETGARLVERALSGIRFRKA